MKKTIIALSALFITLATNPLFAESNERGHPPAEAFEVCEGKSEGDTVTITTPEGDSIEGTCTAVRGDELVAMPAGGPPQGGRSQGGRED